jgi:hypothetical protein
MSTVPGMAALSLGLSACNDTTYFAQPPLPGELPPPPLTFIIQDPGFISAASQTSATDAYIVSADSSTLSIVPNARDHIYPNWSTDGKIMVIFNNSAPQGQPVRSARCST